MGSMYHRPHNLRNISLQTKFINNKIGYGVFTNRIIEKNVKICTFKGNIINEVQRKGLSKKESQYVVGLGNGKFLSCYEHALMFRCIASNVNSALGTGVSNNAELVINNDGASLWSTNRILPTKQIMYPYGPSFKMKSV